MSCRRIGVAVLVLAAVVVTGMITIPWAVSLTRHGTEREKSLDVLAEATNRDDIESAVTQLGVVLDTPDGEWIAVRYRDSHAYVGYSIAVALTSDGQWLESDEHYCGLFATYRHFVEQVQEANEIEQPELAQQLEDASFQEGHLKRLRRIETQCTLAEAVDELRAMSFQPIAR